MKPSEIGSKYNRLASWWNERHFNSEYGVKQVENALAFVTGGGTALDVGCGSGGRLIRLMQNKGLSVTGLDVSEEMVRLASINHPQETFLHQDIVSFTTEAKFNFIIAWDSLFHLPIEQHSPVLTKLCDLLAQGGVIIYTFGDAIGSSEDAWRGETLGYSSIGIQSNLQLLGENKVTCKHLELDQFPETHVYVIGVKA